MFDWSKIFFWLRRDGKRNFKAFRNQLLSGRMVSLADQLLDKAGVYAVLMEVGGASKSVQAVVGFFDGDAFLFSAIDTTNTVSNKPHRVSPAAKAMCVIGTKLLSSALCVHRFPAPSAGKVIFYFLTRQGTFTLEGEEKVLKDGKNELYLAGCEVMDEMRLVKKELAEMGLKKSF